MLARVYPAFHSMVAGISQEIMFFLGVIYNSFERKSHTIQSMLSVNILWNYVVIKLIWWGAKCWDVQYESLKRFQQNHSFIVFCLHISSYNRANLIYQHGQYRPIYQYQHLQQTIKNIKKK